MDENPSYIVTHVFLPPKLPQENDQSCANDYALCDEVYRQAEAYQTLVPETQHKRWNSMLRMLMNLRNSQDSDVLSAEQISNAMAEMGTGDTLALLIRAQNAAVILRKRPHETIFESFEVAPPAAEVMKATGKLLCSYPGPAISVPRQTADDPDFRDTLSSFLANMHNDVLDSAATTIKARSEVLETRDSPHPRYITQLLTGILRGMGQPAEITRIRKRIADDVVWDSAAMPWRRSSLWLVIRVALQMTLYYEHDDQDHTEYKAFMVFLMAGLLRRGVELGLPSEIIYCMRAKMSRRLYKLGLSSPEFLPGEVRHAGEFAEEVLQARWSAVQNDQAKSPSWDPESLDILQDTHLSLRNSRDYLSQALQHVHSNTVTQAFQPSQFPRLRDTQYDFRDLEEDSLIEAFHEDISVALADFETSVQNHLDDWVSRNLYDQSTCATISLCIKIYAAAARNFYASNPEDQSSMLLTIFDLFVALDKAAVAQYPLLREYSPEISLCLLEPLLIRKSAHLHRLVLIREYLSERSRNANAALPSIFADRTSVLSFSIRYFAGSQDLQRLRKDIETDAAQIRRQKKAELQDLNRRHAQLMAEARDAEHEYTPSGRHRKYCDKCQLEIRAKHMKIEVHEWPLPQTDLEAKATVFELRCPLAFGIWRTTVYKILSEICQDLPTGSANPPVLLETYGGLQKYVQYAQDGLLQITYGSTTKSFSGSHYKTRFLPATESEVFVNNGLNFRLYDRQKNRWVKDSYENCSVDRYCSFQLPAEGPYKSLQYAVDSTSHTSNDIIANQSECPKDMSIHEFIAFGTLRSGSRLQWLNIARELPTRSLSFRREEVHALLMQAAWQIGPLSQTGVAEWHVDLSDPAFGLVLLSELESLLLSVEANWLECVSVRTIVMLTSRLLVSSRSLDVIKGAYALLRKARRVSFQWVRQLAGRLQDVEDEHEIVNVQLRVCEAAATCRATYDVDPVHLRHLLGSADDLAVLVECAIQVHDHVPTKLKDDSPFLQQLMARDRRLSHALEDVIQQKCETHPNGLVQAITAIWHDFRLGTPWKRMPKPNDRWITTTTGTASGQKSQRVHLDLLSGRLLVNGMPLGRLPSTIVQHPTYTRIFTHKILDVIPADMPGMVFMTRSPVCGYQVFFALPEGGNLIIRAKRQQRPDEILELIPHEKLSGDLPKFFVENYVHWLVLPNGKDRNACEIELRPLAHLWESSPDNWRIHFSTIHHSKMRKSSSFLFLDVYSPTYSMISERLKPLEHAEYITITCSPDGHSLLVDLPRYTLSFFLNDKAQLESKNFPGMVIDQNQSTGTMFGLFNQLVLGPKQLAMVDSPCSRRVIIPHGDIRFEPCENHVSVTILTGSQDRVRYHVYKIDTDLGRLVGNGSLISRFYKIYLHAVTSHCLPDPLTERTSTEEALSELGSAGCLSFSKLGDDEAELLDNIRDLTPKRRYYPSHLKVMQTVHWSRLGFMAQHHGFLEMTHSVLDYAQSLQMFHDHKESSARRSVRDTHLLDRAALRNKALYPYEYAGRLTSQNGDTDLKYDSRDLAVSHGDHKEASAFTVSAMVDRWPSRLNTTSHLFTTIQAWDSLSGPVNTVALRYTRDWLEDDLSTRWMSLYNLCRSKFSRRKRFELTFTLSAMSYKSPEYRNLFPTIVAFATVPQFRTLHPPPWSSYTFCDGFKPSKTVLLRKIHASAVSLEDTPAADLAISPRETLSHFTQRQQSYYKQLLDSRANELVDDLISQWPCWNPLPPRDKLPCLFKILTVMDGIGEYFKRCYKNSEIRDHMHQVQDILDQVHGPDSAASDCQQYTFVPCANRRFSDSAITFKRLFKRVAPKINTPSDIPKLPETIRRHQRADTKDLGDLLTEFQRDSRRLHRLYGNDLAESRAMLDKQTFSIHPDFIPDHIEMYLRFRRNYWKQCVQDMYSTIRASLSPSNPIESAVFTSGQWPRLTTKSLLGKLASASDLTLKTRWTTALTSFAHTFLKYQHSQRLLDFAVQQCHEEFFKELDNADFDESVVMQSPDWLLIQVDCNFLVRRLQHEVAKEMISPSSGENAILQLNMGEGKSSVIAPLVAGVLADGRKLARVVVLKPLAHQMFQLLVDRLSGLTNRRIFYMPFSRDVRVDADHIQNIQDLYETCARERGVLVVQPEHILSYRLIGVDRLLCADASVEANALLKSQGWLNTHSRDVFDESDEILNVRYQLIYTVGQQNPIEGHPDRWTTIQQIFALVKKHGPQVLSQYPLGVEIDSSNHDHGSFPHIRILEADAGKALVLSIARDVLDGALSNVTLNLFPEYVREALMRFITIIDVSNAEAHSIDKYCKDNGSWKSILLLRGLLAHGLLVYVLRERRWRVDYGLDPSRSMLAVPYRAKDVPALRAEFGHPDVAIALTCLSYYYGGLTDPQLDLCFELLFGLDNPCLEYETWIRNDQTIPSELRDIGGINTKDSDQRKRLLIPVFRRNNAVIDFYLSHVVFPKEAKEFPSKLTTSGWDLAEKKVNVTTGFSGTNDSRYLLPTSITQCDPVNQLSTNAKVLSYLLRPENDCYLCLPADETASAKRFLELLVDQTHPREIRVLLDVGAQMLEFSNRELVDHWLSLVPQIPAAIYFSDTDELTVLTRDGNAEPFISSPFNQQLDKCLVYLDDAHTRGTDLKLPRGTRAAVTLGPKVTKDRLLQGCMRMRKLGHGQSVMFIAPPEIDRQIHVAAGKSPSEGVKVLDILRWTMLETCSDILHRISHWAQQGVDYQRRREAWLKYSSSPDSPVEVVRSSWLQPEARTLQEMYGMVRNSGVSIFDRAYNTPFGIPVMRERLSNLGVLSLTDTRMDEEQEREVSHEMERECQIERPPKARAAIHQVHRHVSGFVETGIIPLKSPAFVSLFSPLEHIVPPFRGTRIWSQQLLATADFATTIQRCSPPHATDYLRPVNWILSCATVGVLVVISPFEVNALLPDIRRMKAVHLHMYAPRVTNAMKCFDDLQFHCIPALPKSWVLPATEISQLNLWAGQLYFSNYEAYKRLCMFLGVYTRNERGLEVQSDGFIKPEHRSDYMNFICRFTQSPLPFVKELIGLRQKGRSYLPTHLGHILRARLLKEADFDRNVTDPSELKPVNSTNFTFKHSFRQATPSNTELKPFNSTNFTFKHSFRQFTPSNIEE